MTKRGLRGLGMVCLVAISAAARADDWPQWRGPARDGHGAASLPDSWPKGLKPQWKLEVGAGHASPVVAGGRVFVLSRQGENEVVRAVSLDEGKELWAQSYPAPFTISPYALGHGKGPKATPVVSGDRLFTLGIGGILSGWDAQTGKRLWQQDFAQKYTKKSFLFYGNSASPLVDGKLLIANVGAHDQGTLAAFQVETGQIQWQREGDGPSYASPIALTVDGTRQIVTQSQNATLAVAAADGSPLWSMEYKTEYDQNIITPVVAGQLVIFGGLDKPTEAYRLKQAGGKWVPEQVWQNKELALYMSTPVLVGDRLVGLSSKKKGQFMCVDAASGKTLWSSDGRMGDYASLLVVGDTVLALTNPAELIVFKPSADRFAPLARYKVSAKPTWAHLALVGKQILVKDDATLAAWTW